MTPAPQNYATINELPSALQNSVNQWFDKNPNATAQQIFDTIQANGGLTPEGAQAIANRLGTTPQAVQSGYSSINAASSIPDSYAEQLKQTNPAAYAKIADIAKFSADEIFGGNIRDFQLQLLTPLGAAKNALPKQLEFTASTPQTFLDDSGNPYTSTPQPQVKTPGGFETITGESGAIDGYRSKTPTNINGLPVFATYDDKGKLTGYEGDPRYATAVKDKDTRLTGRWDAQGNPNPISNNTKGQGFIDSGDLGLIATLAASYFGAPLIGEALGLTGTTGSVVSNALINAASGKDFGQIATSAITGGIGGAIGNSLGGVNIDPAAIAGDYTNQMDLASDAANASNAAAVATPVTSGQVNIRDLGTLDNPIVPPVTTGTPINAVSPTTAPSYTGPSKDSLAADNIDVGGGFNPATGTGDAATRAAAAATGVTSSASTPYGSTSTPTAPVNFVNPVATTAASSLLTPTNALIAKSILDTVGSDKTVSGINSAAAIQQAAYDQSKKDLAGLYANQQGYQRPYMATGLNALGTLGSLGTGTYQMYDAQGNPTTMGTGSGYLQHQFDASDLAKGLAPNYDFMLQQGQMANQRAANMAGGGFGGNALQGLNRYTQDYAGNAYQNAFTNYQNQRQNIFGDLTKLADIGQGATKDLTAATGAYGTNLTNLNVGNAAAQAAAQVAAAQQTGTNISNIGNTAVVATLLGQNPGIAKTPVV